MTSKRNYTFKRLEDKDIKNLQYIFWKAFRKRISAAHLQKKYDTSYIGVKYTCCIAYDKQLPIAFYGNIPQKFCSNNDSLLTSQVCDSFTIPQYQKQGLHYTLALQSYDIMRENGLKFAFAFHSENTYYSSKKLDWLDYGRMQRFHLYPTTVPISKAANKLGLRKYYYHILKPFLHSYQHPNIENPEIDDHFYAQQYSEGFYHHRESYNEHISISLNECVFWLKIDSIMRIGFFDAQNAEQLKGALKMLKSLCSKMGVSEILFQSFPNTKQANLLKQFIEPQESWIIGYFPFDNSFDINQLRINFGDFDTF